MSELPFEHAWILLQSLYGIGSPENNNQTLDSYDKTCPHMSIVSTTGDLPCSDSVFDVHWLSNPLGWIENQLRTHWWHFYHKPSGNIFLHIDRASSGASLRLKKLIVRWSMVIISPMNAELIVYSTQVESLIGTRKIEYGASFNFVVFYSEIRSKGPPQMIPTSTLPVFNFSYDGARHGVSNELLDVIILRRTLKTLYRPIGSSIVGRVSFSSQTLLFENFRARQISFPSYMTKSLSWWHNEANTLLHNWQTSWVRILSSSSWSLFQDDISKIEGERLYH